MFGNTTTFNDAVTLSADTTITDVGDVNFNNTVNGAYDLTVNSGGTLSVGGLIGDTAKLASFAATADTIFIASAGSIATANSAIDLTADNVSIGGAVNAGSAIITSAPKTAGQLIDLGGADAVCTLDLTDAELNLSLQAPCALEAPALAASPAPTQSAWRGRTPFP
ncbi:MAG: hypothetical protein MO846_06345 [Candidatus Devosia symbiotica]|nr:hypothetical protein [Candidatus Devosia symbiotica]